MANLKKVARKGYSAAVQRAKDENKPLELWPGDVERVELEDLPVVYLTDHPMLVHTNHLYLDSTTGDSLDAVRHLLHPSRLYAITGKGQDWTRVTEYMTKDEHLKLLKEKLK